MRRLATSLLLVLLTACSGTPHRPTSARPTDVVLYVVKRGWHIDLGFAAVDLHPPLRAIESELPDARYFLFGFGDRHYLLTKDHNVGSMLAALWPGPGVVLLTALKATPEDAFGADEVIRLRMTRASAKDLEAFMWKTLSTEKDEVRSLAAGPYEGSLYFASVERYSAFHTCNTWAAQGLRAAGFPVSSFGVEFSEQVWEQVRRIAPRGGASRP